MVVKQTPLTEEERALVPHDLKKLCGKQTDQQKVLESLHLDLRQLLEEMGEVTAVPEPSAAPVKTAPVMQTVAKAPTATARPTTQAPATAPRVAVTPSKPQGVVVTAKKPTVAQVVQPVEVATEPDDINAVDLPDDEDDLMAKYETEEQQ